MLELMILEGLSKQPKVSINSFVEFMSASDRRKRSIVKQQKHPSTIQVAPYATARAALRKFIKDDYDLELIVEAIEKLQHRDQSTQWRRQDTKNSIDALRHFMIMNFPSRVSKIKCSFAKSFIKDCYIDDVLIMISPDLIMRWEIDGVKYIGAVKFRLSQKRLDFSGGHNAATLISHYLKTTVAQEDEIVDLSHCLYVDIFSENIYRAMGDLTHPIEEIRKACKEYSKLWRAA